MRRIFEFFCVLLVATTSFVGAQEAADIDRDVFAPFVSRLRVAVRDPQVRLTWRDSPDLPAGSYQVYRSPVEITRDTLDRAELVATVDPGVETYLDTPFQEGEYYYAVLAAEPDGRLYPIFVPFRNKSIRPVEVTRLESEEDIAATVEDIEARVQDNVVILQFDPSRTGRSLAVYRSTVPFSELGSLAEATQLDQFPSANRRYADYPVPGVAYFYGVFDTGLIERGSAQFRPGENVLAQSIEIGVADLPVATIALPRATKRRAPLPMLSINTGIQDGERLATSSVPRNRSSGPLGADTEMAIRSFVSRAPASSRFSPEPVILPQERVDDQTGVPLTLGRIVTGEFADGSYLQAANLLGTLLELPMSPETERRVRFYRGQALFFDGRHESAFMEFLLAGEDEMYAPTRPWIEGILGG